MKVKDYFLRMISRVTGKDRNIDNILSCSDWQFIQLGNYTSAAPLYIAQGSTSKITFQLADITFSAGRDLNLSYDYAAQKFTPQTLGDVFLVEVRFKAKCSKQNGYFDVRLECPTVAYNPIQSITQGLAKAAGVEQFVSMSVPVFIGADLITNGLEVKATALDGNLSIYDVSYMVVRLTSGIN